MIILDLNTGRFSEPDTAHYDNYPDEVLHSEWNPALAEIEQVQSINPEPSKPAPAVIMDNCDQMDLDSYSSPTHKVLN